MKDLRVGVVNPETWDFFRELFAHLETRYGADLFSVRAPGVPVFKHRIERLLLKRSMDRFLRNHDVVFFEWASDLLSLASGIAKSARIVTRLHRWELYKWADRINWGAVDRVIVVSEAKRREFVSRFPAHSAKVTVIPEFIDVSRFCLPRRPYSGTIGVLCHIGPRKRVYELVLALHELRRRGLDLRLRIGGDTHPGHLDYAVAVRRLVHELRLGEFVSFDGFIGDPTQWYPQIDVFVSNSYSEGLQVSPMEAMASGCLVLSHRWDGAEELLPHDCLYFTEAELLEKVAAFASLTEGEREEGRNRMRGLVSERFDSAANVLRISAIIDEVAGRGNGPC